MISKKFDSLEEFLANWGPYFQKVADLQEFLFSQPPDCDPNEIIEKIPKYFYQSPIQLYQLFVSIYSLHFSRESHRDLCKNLFKDLLPNFLKLLPKEEFISMIEFQSKNLYLFFFNLNVITIDQIINNIEQYDDPYEFLYFHDIIEEKSNEVYNELKNKYIDIFNSFDLRDFKNRRQIGKNDSLIALSIRNDDINKCQTIISSLNIQKDFRIPYSIYETIEAINKRDNMPTLLEYAAFFGSINCFKYLIMNNFIITQTLISYAIFGGNIEIIHICENIHAPLNLALRSSICCFRDDLYEYFQESKDVKFTDSAICSSIRNYNINALIQNLQRIYENPNICDDAGQYPILIASERNFADILYMLISSKYIQCNVFNSDGNTPIMISVENNRKLIFDALIKDENVDVNKVNLYGENLLIRISEINRVDLLLNILSRDDIIVLNPEYKNNEIICAINNGYLDLVKIFFDHEKYKDKVTQLKFFKFFVISAALKKEWDIVDFLLSRFDSYLNILKIVDIFFKDDKQSDIYKTLRKKIYHFSKLK